MMKSHALVIALALGCSSGVSSCAQDRLLGEDSCFGPNTQCKSDAPTLSPLTLESRPFDVVASRTLTPRWMTPLPCDAEYCGLELGTSTDGSTWANVSEGRGGTLVEVRDGVIQQEYGRTISAFLLMDEARQAHLMRWESDERLHMASLEPDGTLSERRMPTAPLDPHTVRLVSLESDGSVTLASFAAAGRFAARYDAAGGLLWQQDQLRTARRFPYEDLGPALAPDAAYGLLPLSDGSVAIGLPKYTGSDAAERGLAQRSAGVTVLDRDGNVRWDAALAGTLEASRPLLAAGPDAMLAVTFGSQDNLLVMAVDSAAAVLAVWLGLRVGYHTLIPHALCVDEAGSIYVALTTGERDARRHMLCKFDSRAPESEPVCAALELPDPLQPQDDRLAGLGFGIAGLSCATPGQVVVAPQPYGPDGPPVLVGIEL
jgi:hypothetical protein